MLTTATTWQQFFYIVQELDSFIIRVVDSLQAQMYFHKFGNTSEQ